MPNNRLWAIYPASYRARELKILAGWIAAGESGTVVGLPGCGRSNLLGFVCHRPEVFRSYLPAEVRDVVLIPVDLNNLPANNLSTLYRVILRAFHRVSDQFEPSLQQTITTLFKENRVQADPFLPQSALQELLLLCQSHQIQVVLVLNHFDRFFQSATPPMVNTLRGLRDDFKDTLCYIADMPQEAAYLPDPGALGHLYELLDNYICWVGSMTESDARTLITRVTRTAPIPPSEAEISRMLALTGGFPALLRAVCFWWLGTLPTPPPADWVNRLMRERSIDYRLRRIWEALTQEEQFVLSELQRLQTVALGEGGHNGFNRAVRNFVQSHQQLLNRLAEKGVCRQTETGWCLVGELLAAYVAGAKGRGRGRIWLDETSGDIYQGQTLLTGLTELERLVLAFLIKQPRLRHTKTDLIFSTWPDELRQQGVTDNSLYQVVLAIRRAIEPTPSQPVYLVTWRGKPEGGYQFFPEGRPG
jgi:hypothetical protein